MILGFHHKLDEMCAVLGNYAVFSGTSLQTFVDTLSVSFRRDIPIAPKHL